MEPPPVQYVRTRDGFDIAYTVCGEGTPFVLMPWPFSHRGLWWQSAFGRPLSSALAERFRLVQYDSRGQGMSTRSLPEGHSIEDYVTDLEAVVDHLGLEPFVLYGAPLTGHVAVRYAVMHPERVEALILGDTAIDTAFLRGLEELARNHWDTFLHVMASSYSLDGAPPEVAYWRESINREDFLRLYEASLASNISSVINEVRVPTLIVNARTTRKGDPETPLAVDGRVMAATMPNARLILYDGFASVLYSSSGEPPRFVNFVEDFLAEVRRHESEPSSGPLPARLTPREIEVLRLVADGRTNREIARILVISERTVINHLSNIFTKTGAENRAAAAAFALRHRLA